MIEARALPSIVSCAIIAAAGLALSGAATVHAGMNGPAAQWTQTTPTYTVELDIVPAMEMLTPDQAQSATSGMVMVSMPNMGAGAMNMGSSANSTTGMNMASSSASQGAMAMTMATTDDGQPVNHHLGVHVHTTADGKLVSDIMPAITILNESTGESRMLNDVMPMYDLPLGPNDLHFGNNVYLPDGTYTVTVGVGSETASFSHIQVSGGSGLPASSANPATSPSSGNP